jgi:hypothetical protein
MPHIATLFLGKETMTKFGLLIKYTSTNIGVHCNSPFICAIVQLNRALENQKRVTSGGNNGWIS